jgi:hypothetical protein
MDTVPIPENPEHLPPHRQPEESELCRLCGGGWFNGHPQHTPGCPNEDPDEGLWPWTA